ncbi:ATP-dependent nuclease [Streptomyces sp. NPDC093221]|uniref:ATP-dependent nuclease n=1 Tax=Streptomyces sp. NPDC093221 TaxID=3366032 RepID=UPI0038124C3A
MGIAFGVSRLLLTDGTTFNPPMNGMTVFIGPNNSGKSVLLSELVTQVSVPGSVDPKRWIQSLDTTADGSVEDFFEWLHNTGITPRPDPHTHEDMYPGPSSSDNNRITKQAVGQAWSSRYVQSIQHLLVSYQKTEDRLYDRTSSQTWNLDYPPSHPSQFLWDSRSEQEKFSQLVVTAFGTPISIDRYSQGIYLRVGETGMEDEIPPPSAELRAAYSSLPTVAEQGDGFRSFVNILLHTLAQPTPLVVIDEPEAFLHPPQARLLGRFLAERTPSSCQVIVATHSSDFLAGVTEASAGKELSLVRISRPGGDPLSRVLNSEEVSEIIKTPLLRYSNIISGLFHDGVVLCEAEGDCQFYAATFDIVKGDSPHDNFTFLHVNGKARLADAAKKLRQCGIPVAVIYDIDVLNDKHIVQGAVSSLGGKYGEFEKDLDLLHQETATAVTVLTARQVRDRIAEIVGQPQGRQVLTGQQSQEIADLLKAANGWKQLKKSGLGALSGTQSYSATQRMIRSLSTLGIFVVPTGELECWIPEIPSGNKRKWLTNVFEEGLHRSPSSELRDFTIRVREYLLATAAGAVLETTETTEAANQ